MQILQIRVDDETFTALLRLQQASGVPVAVVAEDILRLSVQAAIQPGLPAIGARDIEPGRTPRAVNQVSDPTVEFGGLRDQARR